MSAVAARRAVLRWAWRMFRRDWRQQLLVLVLVSVSVTAAVAGTTMAWNGFRRDHGFGDADAIVRIDPAAPDAEATLEAVRDRFGEVEVIGHRPARVPGFDRALDLREQTPGGRFGGPLLDLLDGRYPTATDEIALTPAVADELGAGIGERVELDRRTWRVVGEVENPSALGDPFALVAPGALEPEVLVVLVDRDAGSSAAGSPDGAEAEFGVIAIGDDDAAVATLVLVVDTLALSLTALVATAGFVVVAQRRQRQLGLLAALGASERHLRLTLVANGLLVGVVGAAAGTTTGLLTWFAAAPAVERAAGHRIDRLAVPWGLVAASVGMAVLASVAAAWWPARTTARLPIVAALARRPGPPQRVRRSVAAASGLVLAGAAAIAASRPLGEVRAPFLLVGLVAVVAGVVLSAPAAIRLLGVAARRLPFAPRLALRDLARFQARAAGALGAIALGLGVSVAVVVVAKANEDRPEEGNLSSSQLLVEQDPETGEGDLDGAVARIAEAVGTDDVLELLRARNPAPVGGPPPLVEVGTSLGEGDVRFVDGPFVATPEVLAAFDIDPASIEPGTELLSGLDRGGLVLLDVTRRAPAPRDVQVQPVDLSGYDEAPQSLITEAAMAEHGWVAVPTAWLIEADHPLTDDEVDAAREVAAAAGLSVEDRHDNDTLAAVRAAATVVGAALALAIVAMAISLLRGESAQDVRTLTATGAPPRTRRALTASTAGALAGLGAVLGLGAGYLALLAAYQADLGRLAPVPVGELLTIALGLPLTAVAAGWLLGGREPSSPTRPAFD